MDKVQKPSISVCYTPSSQPYRIYCGFQIKNQVVPTCCFMTLHAIAYELLSYVSFARMMMNYHCDGKAVGKIGRELH
jgi:hypothetical protein